MRSPFLASCLTRDSACSHRAFRLLFVLPIQERARRTTLDSPSRSSSERGLAEEEARKAIQTTQRFLPPPPPPLGSEMASPHPALLRAKRSEATGTILPRVVLHLARLPGMRPTTPTPQPPPVLPYWNQYPLASRTPGAWGNTLSLQGEAEPE